MHALRRSLLWLSALGLLGCGAGDVTPAPARPGPNLLLISIDSLRADHLGAYGYSRDTSPRLDALAAEGVLFENFIAETSWTLPSHVTLLTGLASRVHGVVHDGRRIRPEETTLAEILAQAGYRTEAYVSAPYLHPVFGFAQGFERYEVVGQAPEADFEAARHDPAWQRKLHMASHRTRTSPELAARVENALTRLRGEPFFLFVHMFDVHYDYTPPEAYWRRFDPDYTGDFDPSDYKSNPAMRPDMPRRELRHVIALYDGEIRWTDEYVGHMLDTLADLGLADDTVVAVVADHGDEFFEHGGYAHHRTLFDEVLRVPFLLRLPGRLPAGLRIRSQVRMVDVTPTLLDLLGVPTDVPMSGRSLVGFIDGSEPPHDLPAVSYLYRRGRFELRTLREGDDKLLVWKRLGHRKGGGAAFFDLATDPDERHPARSGPALREARSRLRALEDAQTRLAAAEPRAAPEPDIVLEPALRQALEKLGYLDAGDDADADDAAGAGAPAGGS